MSEETDPAKMRAREAEKAAEEEKLARSSEDAEERKAHERRAEKAAYLADKLSEQEQAPDEP
ncbi:MAG TPA: hypothetical protein VMD48_05955 [Solirubrobacteraceae bacterium]|nr:hypothetical protein [Solirubrobacteraceae bacterium]